MSATVLEIRSDLKMQFDHLAEEVHRSESELANEAVTLSLRNATSRGIFKKGWRRPSAANW